MTQYDDPYDPAGPSLKGETPQLTQVLENAINTALADVHTAMPGKVVAIKGTQKIDVQPLLQRRYKNGPLVNLPVIQDVPVIMPSGANYFIQVPMSVGDTGMIVFAERSIDQWLVAGGFSDPNDIRKHDISDAMFYPGLNPFSGQVTGDPANITIHNKTSDIIVKPDGKFQIKNPSNELFDLLVQTVQAIIDARINTIYGPQQVINFADFMVLKTKLETLKG